MQTMQRTSHTKQKLRASVICVGHTKRISGHTYITLQVQDYSGLVKAFVMDIQASSDVKLTLGQT